MLSEKNFNLFYLNNSLVNFNFIKISEINISYNLTENSSLIFIDQNNQISLNFVLVKNCNFSNNFSLIDIWAQNNNISVYETYFYKITGNGKIALVKNGYNNINFLRIFYIHSSLLFICLLDELISDNNIQIQESTFNNSFEKIGLVSCTVGIAKIC